MKIILTHFHSIKTSTNWFLNLFQLIFLSNVSFQFRKAACFGYVFCLFFASTSLAQSADCNCVVDLDFLHKKLVRTPAYRVNKSAYNVAYDKVSRQAHVIKSDYDCFVLLNKLLLSLNDNHMNVLGVNNGANNTTVEDSLAFHEFKLSKNYSIFPKPKIDIDSLIEILGTKPLQDIEGIYSRDNGFTIGVYYSKSHEAYLALVINSASPMWTPGEVLYTMIPYGNGYLKVIGGNLSTKRLIAYTERNSDGVFINAEFQKDISRQYYYGAAYPDSTYLRKELSDDITYIKVGSFKSFYPTLSDAERFYAAIKNSLTKKHLIVDVRDNGGGGVRNSGILLKILKGYVKSNKIYLLTNHRTASNAEQFVQKLSKFNNCVTLGDRTNGTAAYEITKGAVGLPEGKYLAVFTSKKHANYLDIESKGIEPQVKLDKNQDWIKQVQDYILKNN